MLKDPTKFRERFAKWKQGEQVYENGRPLPAYGGGKDDKKGYRSSQNIRKKISRWEGAAMNNVTIDPLSGKQVGPNRSFDEVDRAFYAALPVDVREAVLSNQDLADSLYSYAYNVGTGNFAKRVGPALQRYYNGQGSVGEIQSSMWAGGDKKLRGLATRRAEERRMVERALSDQFPQASRVPYRNDDYNYYRANQLGYTPDSTGHMPTRDDVTGMYLKSATHPTVMKGIVADLAEGYQPYYNKDTGRLHSSTFLKMPKLRNQVENMIMNPEYEWTEGFAKGKDLPGYYIGKDGRGFNLRRPAQMDEQQVERSDNTAVVRQQEVKPIKRDFIAEAARKHAQEVVVPDNRTIYQRQQDYKEADYQHQQYQRAVNEQKAQEGFENLTRLASPSTYVEAATGEDLGTVGGLVTDAAIFGLPRIANSVGTFVGRQVLKNQLKSEFKRGVYRAGVINDIFKNSPVLYDSGNLLNYNDYLNRLFPNSKIKDILWHGSKDSNLQKFDVSKIGSNMPIKGSVGMYLSPLKSTASSYGSGGVYPVLLNTQNPYITNQFFGISKNGVNVAKITPNVKSTFLFNNDAVIAPFRSEIAFFNPDDALILGSQQDRRQFADFMEALKYRLEQNPRSAIFDNPSKHISYGTSEQPRYIASWDDFQTNPKFGKYFAEGGEAEVYESFNNPEYLTKIKIKIPEEGVTLDDLEHAVNRDLKMNQLPGVEPITYKGFSTQEIIRKSLGWDTSLASDEYVPIWEQRKLMPLTKTKVGAFDNTTYDDLIRTWILQNGYKEDVLSNMLKYGNITISDYIPKNFAFDSYGNLKLIDPKIQKFYP